MALASTQLPSARNRVTLTAPPPHRTLPSVFCLPLDFPSQIILTSAFILSTLPGSLREVHRVLAAPVAAAPWLVAARTRVQAALACGLDLLGEALTQGTLANPRAAAAAGAAGSCTALALGGGAPDGACAAPAAGGVGGNITSSGNITRSGGGGALGGGGGDSPATLLSAVLSCGYVLYVCGVCPLWVAYQLERVYKQRWLQSHPGLAWVNPPAGDAKVGQWPSARQAACQLAALAALTLVASEACIAMWGRLSLPVWTHT
jgi:hypothetical protein